jgi:hypothetical protein
MVRHSKCLPLQTQDAEVVYNEHSVYHLQCLCARLAINYRTKLTCLALLTNPYAKSFVVIVEAFFYDGLEVLLAASPYLFQTV